MQCISWSVLKIFTLLLLMLAAASARAEETSAAVSGATFNLSGDLHKNVRTKNIQGSALPAEFDAEIYGQYIIATIEQLPNDKPYVIEIDLAETFHNQPGKRLMDISCGGKPLAEGLDIFAASGGFAKPYRLRADVVANGHRLEISFNAKVNTAKFNAMRLLDADGNIVASLLAKDWSNADVRLSKIPEITAPAIYMDSTYPIDKRVDDLIARMSVNEKIHQLMTWAPSIERLHLAEYNYGNECLHGVARAGYATVFPQAIAMAATWDTPLIHSVADVIATEARAKYYEAISHNQHGKNCGLTYFTPNINIFRDPRWGRGQETYGEDPF